MPMVSIKQDLYVKIIRDSDEGYTDIAGFIDRTLRSAMKIRTPEPKSDKKRPHIFL